MTSQADLLSKHASMVQESGPESMHMCLLYHLLSLHTLRLRGQIDVLSKPFEAG
jgi:hypothetical protein